MDKYLEGQTYKVLYASTEGEEKEVEFTPEKDTTTPGVITAVKEANKDFFKLLKITESKKLNESEEKRMTLYDLIMKREEGLDVCDTDYDVMFYVDFDFDSIGKDPFDNFVSELCNHLEVVEYDKDDEVATVNLSKFCEEHLDRFIECGVVNFESDQKEFMLEQMVCEDIPNFVAGYGTDKHYTIMEEKLFPELDVTTSVEDVPEENIEDHSVEVKEEPSEEIETAEEDKLEEYYDDDEDEDDDIDEFEITNGYETITVRKMDDGKWRDSDGNGYMGYLKPNDILRYFDGDYYILEENKVEEDDNKLEETTNKQLHARKQDLWNRERQALKELGDNDWENLVNMKSRMPEEMYNAFNAEEREIRTIEMIHSILTYSEPERWTVDIVLSDEYMKKYIDELGEEKVAELIANEIEDYKKATVNKNVHTDMEGVSYNSVTFADDIKVESYDRNGFAVNDELTDIVKNAFEKAEGEVPETIQYNDKTYKFEFIMDMNDREGKAKGIYYAGEDPNDSEDYFYVYYRLNKVSDNHYEGVAEVEEVSDLTESVEENDKYISTCIDKVKEEFGRDLTDEEIRLIKTIAPIMKEDKLQEADAEEFVKMHEEGTEETVKDIAEMEEPNAEEFVKIMDKAKDWNVDTSDEAICKAKRKLYTEEYEELLPIRTKTAKDKLMDIVHTSNSEYTEDDIEMERTPEGNWHIQTKDGKDIVTVDGNIFSEEALEDLRLDGFIPFKDETHE